MVVVVQASCFDTWTEMYDSWFTTPVGKLIRKYESELLLELLYPQPGESVLDVGCGSGLFTQDVLACQTSVIGLDLSLPMLRLALNRADPANFIGLCGDMRALPFADNSFAKVFSMTAIEFVKDARQVLCELERVTINGGCIVVTTLNSLSPWTEQRKEKGKQGHDLFQNIYFRSPDDFRTLVSDNVEIKTAIHFQKSDPLALIPEIEKVGNENQKDTGALLAVQWTKYK